MAAAAMTVSMMQAAVVVPDIYSENFWEMAQKSDYPTDGWTTYGNGAMPAPAVTDMSPLFNADGSGPYYVIWIYGTQAYPFSVTNFNPSQQADQWLVSPEIEIPSDAMELSFTTVVYNGKGSFGAGRNPFKIMVSENGTDKESFTEIYSSNVNAASEKEVVTKRYYIPLNGYKGKKVNLAFVNNGQDLGFTGFTDITVGNYAVVFDNKTVHVAQEGESVTVDVNIGMKTPVTCNSFTVVLEAGDEIQTKNVAKKLGDAGATLVYQRVKFDPVKINGTEALNYKITFTPDYEGAPSSTLTGSVGVPRTGYVNNVVVEELTATGCTWCPSGSASMEYYHDTYPGTETVGKVIPIAIHGNINYLDPMSEGVEPYVASISERNGTTNYPQAIFNRSSRGLDPSKKDEVERQIALLSNNTVAIDEVVAPVGEEVWGQNVDVTFSVRNAYSAETLGLTAAVVMTEDNVKGNTGGYRQTNGFYKYDASFIEAQYGSFLVPYMEKYLSGGELGRETIPFNMMVYQHVARGIFPSFNGAPIEEGWDADYAKQVTLSFAVPENVMVFGNTNVIVMILDESGNIVASDIMPYSNFKTAGVESASGEGIVIGGGKNCVKVYAPCRAGIEVYSADGVCLANSVAEEGNNELKIQYSGMAIVKVTTAGCVKTSKVML